MSGMVRRALHRETLSQVGGRTLDGRGKNLRPEWDARVVESRQSHLRTAALRLRVAGIRLFILGYLCSHDRGSARLSRGPLCFSNRSHRGNEKGRVITRARENPEAAR